MSTALYARPWLAMALVIAWLLGLMLVLRVYQRRREPAAETVRKLFHLGGGAVALALPWIFDQAWPLLVLLGISAGTFVLLRRVPSLQRGPGQVLHAVSRTSRGEFWFVAGIAVLFMLAGAHKVLYVVPVMILAVADTSAALVGVVYGRHRFTSAHGWKSAEGSVAFFFTAFLCVHIPVLLWAGVGRLESLLIGINLAFIVMLAEAISWRGTDNFLLPLVVYLLLDVFVGKTAADLTIHTTVIAGLSAFVFVWRGRTTLSDDALIGASLLGYVFWALGGWPWLVAPAIMFATYLPLSQTGDQKVLPPSGLPVLLAVAAPALFWVGAQSVFDSPELYYPFVAAIAASLAMVCSVRSRLTDVVSTLRATIVSCASKGLVILVPCLLIVDGFSVAMLIGLALGVITVVLATAVFNVAESRLERYASHPWRWTYPSVIAAASSTVCLLPVLFSPDQIAT